MSMSKRTYEALAKAIGTSATVDEAAGKVAVVCQADNAAFDWDVFLNRVREYQTTTRTEEHA